MFALGMSVLTGCQKAHTKAKASVRAVRTMQALTYSGVLWPCTHILGRVVAMCHTIWNNDDDELGAMVCDSD